jgi:hypothetical protein
VRIRGRADRLQAACQVRSLDSQPLELPDRCRGTGRPRDPDHGPERRGPHPARVGHHGGGLTPRRVQRWHQGLAVQPRRRTGRARQEGEDVAYQDGPATEDERRARRDTANRILTNLKAALNFAQRHGHGRGVNWSEVKPFQNVSQARSEPWATFLLMMVPKGQVRQAITVNSPQTGLNQRSSNRIPRMPLHRLEPLNWATLCLPDRQTALSGSRCKAPGSAGGGPTSVVFWGPNGQ